MFRCFAPQGKEWIMAKEKTYIHKWLGKHGKDFLGNNRPTITWKPVKGKVSATQTRIEKRIERLLKNKKSFYLCTEGFRSKNSINEIFFIDGGGWVLLGDGNSFGTSKSILINHAGHFFPFIEINNKCPQSIHFSPCKKSPWGNNDQWLKNKYKKIKPIKTL